MFLFHLIKVSSIISNTASVEACIIELYDYIVYLGQKLLNDIKNQFVCANPAYMAKGNINHFEQMCKT